MGYILTSLTSERKTGEKRNNEIQNLRAIAMFSVLIGHMPIALPNFLLHGYSFVSLFFVISGYLAVISFKRKYDSSVTNIGSVISSEFINRALRLFPLMWIWIFIYFIIGNLIIHYGGQYGDMSRWAGETKAALKLTYNYYLAGLDVGGLFGQYWSLFVEIHFFVLFVFLFAFIKNEKARKLISAGMVIMTVFVFRPLTPVKLIRYATLAHMDSLFIGVLIGLYCEDKVYIQCKISSWAKKLIGILLCVLLFMAGYLFDTFYNDMNLKYGAYTLLSAVILFLARERSGWFDFKGIIGKVMGWCGMVSGSTYVSHVLLYSCIYYNLYYNTNLIPQWIKNTSVGIVTQVIGLIVVACMVGWVSYNLIERPYGLLAKNILKKTKTESRA